jgi:hypothetical protein
MSKVFKAIRADGVTQVVDHVPGKHISTPSTTKTNKQKLETSIHKRA